MKYTHIPPWFAMAFFNFFTSSAHANCFYSGTPPSGSESHYIYRTIHTEINYAQNLHNLPLGGRYATVKLRLSLNATGSAAYQCSPVPSYIDQELFSGYSLNLPPGIGIQSVTIDGRKYPDTVFGMQVLLSRPIYIDAEIVFERRGILPSGIPFLDGIFAQEFTRDTRQLLYEYRFNNPIIPPIAKPTCTLLPIPPVSLGIHARSRFTGTNTVTATQDFDINLNCTGGDAGTSVNATLTFTDNTEMTNTTDALLLSTSNVTGVGVQILRNGNPVQFGPQNAPIGSPNVHSLGTIAQQGPGGGAFNYRIPLQARYKQTHSSVSGAGQANAEAILTINYQ